MHDLARRQPEPLTPHAVPQAPGTDPLSASGRVLKALHTDGNMQSISRRQMDDYFQTAKNERWYAERAKATGAARVWTQAGVFNAGAACPTRLLALLMLTTRDDCTESLQRYYSRPFQTRAWRNAVRRERGYAVGGREMARAGNAGRPPWCNSASPALT